MFEGPTDAEAPSFPQEMYVVSLPAVICASCGARIARRAHRMTLRASWRDRWEHLCPDCWAVVCQWAARFALQQMELPGL